MTSRRYARAFEHLIGDYRACARAVARAKFYVFSLHTSERTFVGNEDGQTSDRRFATKIGRLITDLQRQRQSHALDIDVAAAPIDDRCRHR